jgi:hypothetical protein
MKEKIIVVFIVIIIILFFCVKRKDNFTFPENNILYWPQYYYSFPYNEKNGGIWPPGMYNRLNYWSPGFYTGSGLSWTYRPGMGEKFWPRNRWIRQPVNSSYYNITNGDDYIHKGTASYSNPLFFQ